LKLGTVIALDIATTTGVAWHRRGMPRPFFDSFRLPSDPERVGEACHTMLMWLRNLYTVLRDDGAPITHFFYEKPFIPEAVNSATSERLLGLCACVQMFAFQVKATSCYSIDISEWRKHFIGRGSGFKRTVDKKHYLPGHDPKELAIQRCAEYGWHTDIPDEAEACGILDFSISMMDRGFVEAGLEGYPRPWRDNILIGGVSA
jgi:hypothetical protein